MTPDAAGRLPSPGSSYDVLVIGGGITGAGIARDAALRGWRTLLVEKDDFASGTSSRSSRLVHGGLRYLEHGQLGLVFESSNERRRLLRLAPHLVHPLAFTWPVYRGARLPLWKVNAGVTLYDALALFRNVHRHELLRAAAVQRAEPTLDARHLSGGVRYWDAHTDDARLTLANALDAERAGATVLNHVTVTALHMQGATADGARLRCTLSGAETEVQARAIVNATGPWSDSVRALEGAAARPSVRGSKGVHILVPRERVGNRDALTLLHPDDGRVMFALPAGTFTIFGTTDTYADESPDSVRASAADVDYLLAAANAFFPAAALSRADVVSAWAGIRPLVAASGDTPGAASREHAIEVTPAGVVTITGGKLTTYRIMAAQVVDAVERRLGVRHRCITGTTPLGDDTARREAACTGADSARVDPALEWRFGDLAFAVAHEHARTLGDLLIRRTKLAFERRDNGLGIGPDVARRVAPLLGWTEQDQRAEVERFAEEVRRIFGAGAGA